MQYDVFISYSRKDTPEVNALIDRLRRDIPGIKIWYDIDGIETAEAFRTKIIKAINESNAIIFACSENSLNSEYCEKEVMYAHRKNKTIIPYLLPGMELDGWLLFEFGNINCIHASKAEEVGRMIKDLRRWCAQNAESSFDDFANNGTTNSLESQLYFDSATGEFKQRPTIPTNNTRTPNTTSPANTTQRTDGLKGIINGHQYVDLGLPSGAKWATCNVGASRPEEYGEYFPWGMTRAQSSYDESNCLTFKKEHQSLFRIGYTSRSGLLELSHDAARQSWGATWRMPSRKDIEELISNTTFEWTTLNGVKGCLVKSKRNNQSIFLPACGWKKGAAVKGLGLFGYYWSSQEDLYNTSDAYGFYFTMSAFMCKAFDRSCGRSIRAVSD